MKLINKLIIELKTIIEQCNIEQKQKGGGRKFKCKMYQIYVVGTNILYKIPIYTSYI